MQQKHGRERRNRATGEKKANEMYIQEKKCGPYFITQKLIIILIIKIIKLYSKI